MESCLRATIGIQCRPVSDCAAVQAEPGLHSSNRHNAKVLSGINTSGVVGDGRTLLLNAVMQADPGLHSSNIHRGVIQ